VYFLLRSLSSQQLIREQLPVGMASLLIAEMFYRFHSFTLECVSFLATWYVLDAAFARVRRLFAGNDTSIQ